MILDRDLAKLQQVETRVLNQAVKRNINRFPEWFMFQLTEYLKVAIRDLKYVITICDDIHWKAS